MRRRERLKPVLAAEVARWSAKSCEELELELSSEQNYDVETAAGPIGVAIALLENTPEYLHVMVSVNDHTLPSFVLPLTDTFLTYRSSRAPADAKQL